MIGLKFRELFKIWFVWNHWPRHKQKVIRLFKFFGLHWWDYTGTWVRKCLVCGKMQRMVTADGKPKGDVVKWEDFTYR